MSLLHCLLWIAHEFDDPYAEVLLYHDNLAPRDEPPVDENVDVFAGSLLQFDDRSGPESQDVSDQHGSAAKFYDDWQRYIHEQVEVAHSSARSSLLELHELHLLNARHVS